MHILTGFLLIATVTACGASHDAKLADDTRAGTGPSPVVESEPVSETAPSEKRFAILSIPREALGEFSEAVAKQDESGGSYEESFAQVSAAKLLYCEGTCFISKDEATDETIYSPALDFEAEPEALVIVKDGEEVSPEDLRIALHTVSDGTQSIRLEAAIRTAPDALVWETIGKVNAWEFLDEWPVVENNLYQIHFQTFDRGRYRDFNFAAHRDLINSRLLPTSPTDLSKLRRRIVLRPGK